MKRNYESDKSITWQGIGFSNGVLLEYPGNGWVKQQGDCGKDLENTYDHRYRPW